MTYAPLALLALIPIIIIPWLLRAVTNGKTNTINNNVTKLRMPLVYRIIMLMLFCFCIILAVFILIAQPEDWPYLFILFGFFELPSLIFFITWSLWQVDIGDDSFTYRNFLGIKKKYMYQDLEYVMHPKGKKWYFYKNDKKVFCMVFYIENGDKLAKVYRKYKSRHKD